MTSRSIEKYAKMLEVWQSEIYQFAMGTFLLSWLLVRLLQRRTGDRK